VSVTSCFGLSILVTQTEYEFLPLDWGGCSYGLSRESSIIVKKIKCVVVIVVVVVAVATSPCVGSALFWDITRHIVVIPY